MGRSSDAPSPKSGSTPPSPLRRPDTPRRDPAIDHHRPVRSCIGCRRRRAQSELVRITRTIDGDGASATPVVAVDGPSAGRGAWLCRDTAAPCLDAALDHKQFARAWRIALDAGDAAAIRDALGDHIENDDTR